MSYRVLSLIFLTAWFAAATSARSAQAQGAPAATPQRLVLDMVYNNPGEKPTRSAFNDPKRLADWGYTGQVVDSLVEDISKQLHFDDASTQRFVTTSVTYGRIKYDIINQGWTVLLLGQQGDATKTYDIQRMSDAITAYDRLWNQWKQLKADHPECSTLPKDTARGGGPGLGAAVEKYRQAIKINKL